MKKLDFRTRIYQKIALVMAVLLLFQIWFPTISYALTSGPTQPEMQSFEPVGTTEMVDLFSGDFTYNIPLFEVPGPDGGYPVNLFYNSVTEAEAEASMVGLGWNLGIGAINRQVRGIPDDFNGETINRRTDMKPNITLGLGFRPNAEIFGLDLSKSKVFQNMTLGLKLFYNNYKGIGYDLSPNFGITPIPIGGDNGPKVTSSFGFNLNSMEGFSLNGNISLSSELKAIGKNNHIDGTGSIGIGLGMNSREGMQQIGLNGTTSESRIMKTKGGKVVSAAKKAGTSSYTTLITEKQPASPQVSLPFVGGNLNINLKLGAGLGFFANGAASGFYNEQRLQDANKLIGKPGYGYFHSHNATKEAIMDFGRAKDGSIREDQPNLAVPSSNPDIISVTGHGIGGVYRPHRSDIGAYYDQEVTSLSGGGTFGVELGPPHIGTDINLGFSRSRTLKSDLVNRLKNAPSELGFFGVDNSSEFEPYYFKMGGELTADLNEDLDISLDLDNPIQIKRNGQGYDTRLTNQDKQLLTETTKKRTTRKARASSIQPITNAQLIKKNANQEPEEILPEYQVSYYQQNGTNPIIDYSVLNQIPVTRNTENAAKDKIGGYTTLNGNGARWNFALPVQNFIQKDVVFSLASINETCSPTVDVPIRTDEENPTIRTIDYNNESNLSDDYLDIKEIPEYAHAYMLTSVMGTDYVDTDQTDGPPNEKDKGYWMTIDYVKTSDKDNPYKWRTPFTGANFLKGLKTKFDDDKGTFLYGEREQYYPARLQTKTHCAEFFYSKREDARGAFDWLQNPLDNDKVDAHSYKLDSVKLFSKLEGPTKPLKTVVFDYGLNPYKLCPGVENNTNISSSNNGKLTLKEVYFTYEDNNRGRLSPYQFSYFKEENSPEYSRFAYDRWGLHSPVTNEDMCRNIDKPYVPQGGETVKETLQDNAKAWHLSEIKLPSGASIKVDIERDEYAYVQDRVASQLFNITGFGTNNSSSAIQNLSKDEVNIGDDNLRVFFELEEPIIPNNVNDANDPNDLETRAKLKRYVADLHEDEDGAQLFFKNKVNLFNDQDGQFEYEDVSGYAWFDKENIGLASDNVNGEFTHAWIELNPFPIEVKNKAYHPMIMSHWQFIKTNLADQLSGFDLEGLPKSKRGKRKKILRLFSVFEEIGILLQGFYQTARNRNFGTEVLADGSFIRLNSSDKRKYGGGVRVTKITLNDDWTEEETPVYGTVYEYDKEEELPEGGTRIISSGVATNEPAIGGEESSLRYAKGYKEDLKLNQDEYRTFEYPSNEAYYPAASVGYSQVTVKSLATDYMLKRNEGEETPVELPIDLPQGFATSGVTTHEFYTANDFPIITEETFNDANRKVTFVPIPILGFYKNTEYTGSQGYAIQLNDMHGRPFKITNYGQSLSGDVIDEPF